MKKLMTTVHLFEKIKFVSKRMYNFDHVSSHYLNIQPMKSSPQEPIRLQKPSIFALTLLLIKIHHYILFYLGQ